MRENGRKKEKYFLLIWKKKVIKKVQSIPLTCVEKYLQSFVLKRVFPS